MKSTTSAPPQFLLGGGEMGALIRAKDWTNTPLGAPAHWPQSLRTSLSILLNSGYPMFIWWGTELTMFHNDAYLPVLGKKHPHALGRSAREMWSEIWGQIGGIVEDVFQGKQFYAKDLQMFLGRKGFLEETYWTFSYSPIFSESAEVCGLFCACNEETEKIVRQRRLKTLKEISELSASSAETPDTQDLCYRAVEILAQNRNDIPFVALYMLEKNGEQASLVNTAGIVKKTDLFPLRFFIEESETSWLWQAQQVVYHGETVFIPQIHEKYPDLTDQFSGSSNQALVLPLRKSGEDALAGFLICGISSSLEFDEEYATYLNLVSRQIATGLANARAYAEERRRAEALAPLLICFLKGKDLIIDSANEKFRLLLGNNMDLNGRPFREALPDFQDHLYYYILDVHQSGFSKTLKNIELRSVVGPGSNNRVFDFTCQALRESDGRITRVMVVATDVTAQRRTSEVLARMVKEQTLELTRANQALQKQKEFVDAVIDASVNLITVYDTEKRILSINKQVENIYGLKREEVIGKGFLEIFPGGIEAEKQLDRCLKQGETIHNPVFISAITGRIFESFVIPLVHPNGEVYAAISMAHDNTLFIEANNKLLEVERKNKELEQFAYLASHDLQEPLSTIMSFISLMEEEEEINPAEMSEYFSHIKNSSRRLSNLITDLLEYSRIGHQSQQTLVDFQLVVSEVLGDMQAIIQRKQARIQVGSLPSLRAYPLEIRLLFQNLISNALKFQESKSIPNIEIQARRNGVGWHFVVSDNGIGMEEQFLDRVFIIFQRLHPSSEYEGTGIGLAHCKKIIDLHGGRIWVESTPGLGSAFHFTIPDGYETD